MLITGILPGDCGSWVINFDTGEVLGHIVAVDSFNEVYVVPLQETLRDIKERLGVASVALPTAKVLLDIAMDRTDALVPKPHAYEGQSGYDSGYATMQSSPAPSPPRGEIFKAKREGTDQPSTLFQNLPSSTSTVNEAIKQPLDKSLPTTPTATDEDIKSPLDDSPHKPSTVVKRHFNDWIKRKLRLAK